MMADIIEWRSAIIFISGIAIGMTIMRILSIFYSDDS
jgi:uncharacterized membrane-anchored protein YhcB (DUF1043 family)